MKTLIKLALICCILILTGCASGDYETDKPVIIGTVDTATR